MARFTSLGLAVVAAVAAGIGVWTLHALRDDDDGPLVSSSPTAPAAHARDPIALTPMERRPLAQDLTLIDGSGTKLKLSHYWTDKPVLVHFWATWCTPCVAELPGLDAMAKTLNGKLTILPVSLDRDGLETARKFLADHHYTNLAVLALAPDSPAPAVLPVSILVDRSGHEAWRTAGAHPWTGTDTAQAVEALR